MSFAGIQFWLSGMSRIRLHSVCPSVFITASLRLSSAESTESIMVAYCLSLQQAPCHCGMAAVNEMKGQDLDSDGEMWSQKGGSHRSFVDKFA